MNSQPIEVELIWIRHGESCSNLISPIFSQYFPNIGTNKEIVKHVENTHLSNFGISHIHSLKEKSDFYRDFNPDLIVCSQLIRTIETAYLLFYDKLKSSNKNSLLSKFFISPFISEFAGNLKMYEIPHSPKETLKRFHQFQSYLAENSLYPVKELQLNYIRKDPRPNQKNTFKNASSINTETWLEHYFKPSSDADNYDLFISQILPLLIQKIKSKPKIQIAVVCHGNYIERHVLKTIRYNKISPGKYEKIKEKTIDPNIHIFYSPPKNLDAYFERYIFTPDNSLHKEPTFVVEQVFPEKLRGVKFLAPGQIPKDNKMNPKFNKYDKFKFLFYPELEKFQFNIKNPMNITRILKLIESYIQSRYTNFNYQEQLNDNNSELWQKILGLCHIEQLVPYYKTDYNRRPEPITNPKNNMEGGKKNMIIHILGPSGAGKTTLGKRLSKLPNTIVIDTDDIDDPNSIKIISKYSFETKSNARLFDKEVEKKNKKDIDRIIKDNQDKMIIFVGFFHDGMRHIEEKVNQGFIIEIEPERLYRQYNMRTLTSLHKNYNGIMKLIQSKTHHIKIHKILSKKYGIRSGFDCAGVDDMKASIQRNKKRAKEKGYKYESSDRIYKDIQKLLIKQN